MFQAGILPLFVVTIISGREAQFANDELVVVTDCEKEAWW